MLVSLQHYGRISSLSIAAGFGEPQETRVLCKAYGAASRIVHSSIGIM